MTTAMTYMGLTMVQWMTLAVFTATIIAIVINKLDSTVAALLGVTVMIVMGTMTDAEAAKLVDWNVMAILIGIWIIAGYFGKSGVPSWMSVKALEWSGGRPGLLVMILSMLTGLLSMFIDNVGIERRIEAAVDPHGPQQGMPRVGRKTLTGERNLVVHPVVDDAGPTWERPGGGTEADPGGQRGRERGQLLHVLRALADPAARALLPDEQLDRPAHVAQ